MNNTPATSKRAYTLLDLLEFVGRTKIYEEISAGRLKRRKIGRKNIFLAEDVEDWLKSLPQTGSDVDGDIEPPKKK